MDVVGHDRVSQEVVFPGMQVIHAGADEPCDARVRQPDDRAVVIQVLVVCRKELLVRAFAMLADGEAGRRLPVQEYFLSTLEVVEVLARQSPGEPKRDKVHRPRLVPVRQVPSGYNLRGRHWGASLDTAGKRDA